MPHLSNSRSIFDELDLSAVVGVRFAIRLCSGLMDLKFLISKLGRRIRLNKQWLDQTSIKKSQTPLAINLMIASLAAIKTVRGLFARHNAT